MTFKFKLVRYNGKLHFVSSSGTADAITMDKAREYFFNYEKLDTTPTTIAPLIEVLENYEGELLLSVNEAGILEIHDPVFFRSLINPDEFPYLTTQEFADKYQKQRSIVIRLCKQNRIEGAVQVGQIWYIPKTSKYPHDNRLKTVNGD